MSSVERAVRFGTAKLTPDPWRATGMIVTVDDVPQSYVDLADPSYLRLPYIRWIARTVDHHWPAGAPIVALHIGGAACTLPRYIAATRPDSTQTVFDTDDGLVELVREHLGLDDVPGLHVQVQDGRSGLAALPDNAADLVVLDVFRGGDPVTDLATVEFVREIARVLRPGGLYATNLWAATDLAFALGATAAATTVFDHALTIAEPSVFMKWRPGNLILAASPGPVDDWTPLADEHVACLTPDQLTITCGSAAPLTDDDPFVVTRPDPAGNRFRVPPLPAEGLDARTAHEP